MLQPILNNSLNEILIRRSWCKMKQEKAVEKGTKNLEE